MSEQEIKDEIKRIKSFYREDYRNREFYDFYVDRITEELEYKKRDEYRKYWDKIKGQNNFVL